MSDATILHAQQLDYWNGPAVTRWVTKQEQMDAALAPVTDAAITLAAVQPGERVLDIGCGSGATSMALARLVGPTGQVTGLDVSGPMIELARKRSVGMGNLNWLLADAAAHDFPPGSIDLLFSRFGVMFFGDPMLPPGMNAERIHAGIALALKQMAKRGWHVDLCLLQPDETAGSDVERRLTAQAYDCVVIGAGIRRSPHSLSMFEAVINAVHRAAPGAAIAFNTRPEDSADAAARWLKAD